ncbi:GNAT family N-acetyltransferase [Streptomyces sp. NPDC048606]|uniref:GNAT family N-acetyltransferase n=1 Tax=Streptomyces sp. NPDC048606 TaxID=3154726 RepID=UPI003435C7E9
MPELQLLRDDHAKALLDFERENRAYFASLVPDRGDQYFDRFDERHGELLAEQDAGLHFFHLLVAEDGAILGRVNLIDVADGSAELGYRIAERATGRGRATAAVRAVCDLAVERYGLRDLRAVTTLDNVGSRTVLARTGFIEAGELDVAGRPGIRFVRDLRREPGP